MYRTVDRVLPVEIICRFPTILVMSMYLRSHVFDVFYLLSFVHFNKKIKVFIDFLIKHHNKVYSFHNSVISYLFLIIISLALC